jgi:glycosyltransferase involved in cell wall biosynthesis
MEYQHLQRQEQAAVLRSSDGETARSSHNSHRICIVGSGTRFLSGISYYTLRLINELASSNDVVGILMRRLLPKSLYPGRERVGKPLTQLQYQAPTFDGVDWYWIPSIFGALRTLIRHRPEFLIFQWWSGTVLHSYVLLAMVAKALGGRVIIEFHEVLDTGELRVLPAKLYVKLAVPMFLRYADGFVVHSDYDHQLLEKRYNLSQRSVARLPLASFDQYDPPDDGIERPAPTDCFNILFFGVIRPYKGLEDLIQAFDLIPEDQIDKYWLTIVGEPWENWTLPLDLLKESPYRHRITLVDRYVTDEEVGRFFAGADLVALPYLRSSASGPLHVAMSWGLPLVVTEVGGLVEIATNYEGAVLVPPREPEALLEGIMKGVGLVGKRYQDPYSWDFTRMKYLELFVQMGAQDRAAEA